MSTTKQSLLNDHDISQDATQLERNHSCCDERDCCCSTHTIAVISLSLHIFYIVCGCLAVIANNTK